MRLRGLLERLLWAGLSLERSRSRPPRSLSLCLSLSLSLSRPWSLLRLRRGGEGLRPRLEASWRDGGSWYWRGGVRRAGEGDRCGFTGAVLGDGERDRLPGGLLVLSRLFSASRSLALLRSPPLGERRSPALEGAGGGRAATLLGGDAGGGLGLSICVGL